MEHKHSVYDTDTHFVIAKDTRNIQLESKAAPVIVQHDHNSERLSFELPRYIDGHDMTLCNEVQVHYLNIDASTKDTAKGVYKVEDMELLEADESTAVCSWLISENATQYAGKLNFMIRFACLADDGTVLYRWNTGIYTDLTVASGYDNGEAVTEDFPDILAQWKAELFGIGDTEEQRIKDASAAEQAAIAAKGEAVNASIPADYSALSALADQNRRNKAGAIVLDAQGESIVVNDASEYPLIGLKVFGKSTQDGEPSPDAPVDIVSVENPVVAVCGKNLFKTDFEPGYTETVRGVTFTVNSDRSIRVMGKPTAAIAYNIFENEVFPIGNYFVSGAPATANQKFRLQVNLSINGTEKTGGVDMGYGSKLSVDASVSSLRGYIYVASDAGEVDGVFYPQLESGSVATGYAPYSGQSITATRTLPGIPVSSGGNYTDANGQQWICDEVDLKRGVCVQRLGKCVLTGSEPFEDFVAEYNTVTLAIAHKHDTDILCSHSGLNSVVMWANTSRIKFVVSAFGASTLSEFKDVVTNNFAAGTPVTILYVLPAPIETPLSDAEINAFKALCTNKPNTTILNDAGAYMAVEYVADTKTYIDNKIAELMAQ